MPSEYSPWWSKARMTPAQIRRYLRDLEKARKEAEAKLDPEKEEAERKKALLETEEKLDDAFLT